MLVSIIIPAFNAAATLNRAIDSALAQEYADVEIILVNNNSTDSTPTIMAAAVSAHPSKVRMVNCPTQGCSAARNCGIQRAKGEWLQFLDADDTLEPNKIAAQLTNANADTGWIISPYRICFPDGSSRINRPHDDVWKGLVHQYKTGYTCSNLYHLKSLRAIGYWDEALRDNTDPNLHFELLKMEIPFAMVPEVATNYYQHDAPDRVSTNKPVTGNLRRIDMLVRVNNYLRNNRPAYWEKNHQYFTAALLSSMRILATHSLPAAADCYARHFHPTDLSGLLGQPIISKYFLWAYRLLGFRTTEWLRLRLTRVLPPLIKSRLKATPTHAE